METQILKAYAPVRPVDLPSRDIPSDIEIAQAAELRPIVEVAAALGLDESEIELCGRYKAKV